MAICVTASAAADDGVGVLVPIDVRDAVRWKADLSAEIAARLVRATVILLDSPGDFADCAGRPVDLRSFGAIWCHEDEPTVDASPLRRPAVVEGLKGYLASGRGVLLTGTAAALVDALNVDTVRVKAMTSGNDYGQAGLAPVVPRHPAFRHLDLDRGVLWMSNAVFPAFAEFRPTSNPARGAILARSAGSPEIPLLEYAVGDGRIAAMAWQLGWLYSDAPDACRRNFETLVINLLNYLRDAKSRQPLATRGGGSPPAAVPHPGVCEDECEALELAIRDLTTDFPDRYPRGPEYLQRLESLRRAAVPADAARSPEEIGKRFAQLRREALLANPLLDFDRLLLVKRKADKLGLPRNYESNSSLEPTGYGNQIAILSPMTPEGKLAPHFVPEGDRFVGDVELHFDADRLLFSMPNSQGRWRLFEIGADGGGLHEVPQIQEPDVDNYDACYLPDGRIVFGSTACFTGVPCINGTGHVSNLYLSEKDGRIRQLTVEQDHDWCPTVLNNGRVLYLRWEYTDIPHGFSRILFHMNPDGTEQMEFYGSNSYWPSSMFFARPIPGHPTKVAAIVGGHHELPRMGELVIFDPARGRFEADGAVQRIPGRGRKVAPVALDLPIAQSWPKFLHPYPLSEKYFLVSCKPSADSLWGIYLVDVFDNLVLLREEPGHALLEPIPFRKTPRPPAIADKVDTTRREAEVLISDIYRGVGLRGVPKGAIKRLRLISYQFGYQGMGAEPYSIGLDGPWDPKLVLGTVPVCDDGSARFRIPPYTPIAVQPLDAEGKAVQLMRSWFTAMPGEVVACVGCHEPQNTNAPVQSSLAALRAPAEIEPWRGPARGFAFQREVQPVLDQHCVRCHDNRTREDGGSVCSFVDAPPVPVLQNNNRINNASRFSPSYYQLRRFVRTPTKESDLHALPPWEFHADTTRLVQLLRKGHYDVRLDPEAWDRLITWIDLNAPFHGTWTDIRGAEIRDEVEHQRQRRRAMRKLYAGMDDDPEAIYPVSAPRPTAAPRPAVDATDPRRPVERLAAAQTRQVPRAGRFEPRFWSLPLSDGVTLELARAPAGEFTLGQEDGCRDERPVAHVKIATPFWIGRYEVTNEQFALFDATHDSRLEHGDFLQFSPGERGWTLSRLRQPVVRVSWREAMRFCDWLTQKTGRRFTLPTESQWEYACRAGTVTPLWYGDVDDDFTTFANVSDATHQTVARFAEHGRADVIPPWRPAAARYDDKSRVATIVGSYLPNPWGLFDMHGNVAEWTRSDYHSALGAASEGRESFDVMGTKVVRGGSWYDCPERCRAAFRQAYHACQGIYDVGFRVVCESDSPPGDDTASGCK